MCNCCQTTLVPLSGDRAWVAYRGHTREEIRDHRLAPFDGTRWSAPTSLPDDGWKIAACPVNGPAAAAQGENLAVTWYTAAHGKPRVQARVSPEGQSRCTAPSDSFKQMNAYRRVRDFCRFVRNCGTDRDVCFTLKL